MHPSICLVDSSGPHGGGFMVDFGGGWLFTPLPRQAKVLGRKYVLHNPAK